MSPDPLAELRDWHLPDPLSWWPPAPGWWLAAALVLLAVGLAARWWLKRWRATAVVRATRRQLDALGWQLEADGDARRYSAALSRLLKRLALARYPRERVAGLSGYGWLEFLDATGGGGGFSQGAGRVLVESAYRPETEAQPDPERLRELVLGWVKVNWGRRA
ncbi:DUF4381 domain-containing protein [Thiocystis violacea]|uniref:DUF4381 domain-containing protein n=1 Tax=Thiocystis violacea TaxID=13725 RepID=UPI001905CF8D|nr:DUF4381 domain-containing protein [Thiocystis violacea]MBK1720129.1 hypothetical protein [Thiocystis violacea]